MKRVQLQAVQPTGQAQAFASLGQRLSQHYGQAAGAVSNLVESKHREHVKTVLDGYEAQMDRDLRLGLGELAAKHPNDLQAFNEQAEALVSTTLQGVDPEYLQQFESKARGLQTAYQSQVQTNAIKLQRENTFKSMEAARQAAMADGLRLIDMGDEQSVLESAQAFLDVDSTLNDMVADGFITKADRDEKLRVYAQQMGEQGYLARLKQGLDSSLEEGMAVMDEIREEVPKGFSPDEWDTFTTKAEGIVADWANQQKAKELELSVEIGRQVSNLEIDAKTGAFGMSGEQIMSETERMYQEGYINYNKRTTIITAYLNRQSEQAELLADYETVQRRIDGDDSQTVSQKQVDLYWDDRYGQSIAELPPQQKAAASAEFIDRTKRIPTQIKNQINNDINSGNPQLMEGAIDLMIRINDMRGVESPFTPQEEAFASVAHGLMQNMDASEAVQLARQLTDPKDKARVEAREAEIVQMKYRDGYANLIADEFDTDSVNQARMTKEYQALVESKFKAGMEWSAANEWALNQMKATWGETEVSGSARMMKYPPENFYTVHGSTDYIADQLNNWVLGGNNWFGDQEVENIVLVSDDQTAREASAGIPSYIAYAVGENGLMMPINGRFRPDVQAEIQRLTKENEAKVKREREAQEERQEASELWKMGTQGYMP